MMSRAAVITCSFLAWVAPGTLWAQSAMTVRYPEGLEHGFLTLQAMDGTVLADGEQTQVVRSDRVTTRLVFHFKDGSVQEETTIFSQRHNFRLLSDHLMQKGPAFKHASELWVDGQTGQTKVQYTDDDGKEKVVTERLELPADLANGLVPFLLKNILPNTPQTTVSMVVAAPKPRLIKLVITSEGEDHFFVGNAIRKATRYNLKVEIGGVAGALAPLLGKQPPDTHVWILGDTAPAYLKSEGPSYLGGPIWRTQLRSPAWREPAGEQK